MTVVTIICINLWRRLDMVLFYSGNCKYSLFYVYLNCRNQSQLCMSVISLCHAVSIMYVSYLRMIWKRLCCSLITYSGGRNFYILYFSIIRFWLRRKKLTDKKAPLQIPETSKVPVGTSLYYLSSVQLNIFLIHSQ